MLDEAVDYFTFAKQFGWTSRQTDSEPAWLRDRYQVIFSALAEVRERGR